jgi:hypothetical protein
MTERDQTPPQGSTAVGAGTPAGSGSPAAGSHGDGSQGAGSHAVGSSAAGSSGVSSGAHGPVRASENYYTAPQYTTTPIALRRPDAFAALMLLLAGIAAGVSLLTNWLTGEDRTGLDLVRRGFDAFGEGVGEVFSTGFWQPLAVVLGGAVLFLLGLLMFVPAKTHRFLGVLALVVSLVAGAAVLVPLASENWDVGRFDLGFWFAVAVPVLGVLGGLKAALTGPKSGS